MKSNQQNRSGGSSLIKQTVLIVALTLLAALVLPTLAEDLCSEKQSETYLTRAGNATGGTVVGLSEIPDTTVIRHLILDAGVPEDSLVHIIGFRVLAEGDESAFQEARMDRLVGNRMVRTLVVGSPGCVPHNLDAQQYTWLPLPGELSEGFVTNSDIPRAMIIAAVDKAERPYRQAVRMAGNYASCGCGNDIVPTPAAMAALEFAENHPRNTRPFYRGDETYSTMVSLTPLEQQSFVDRQLQRRHPKLDWATASWADQTLGLNGQQLTRVTMVSFGTTPFDGGALGRTPTTLATYQMETGPTWMFRKLSIRYQTESDSPELTRAVRVARPPRSYQLAQLDPVDEAIQRAWQRVSMTSRDRALEQWTDRPRSGLWKVDDQGRVQFQR